ncbi:GNAT family N-acetyltransferase [Microbacterium sp. SLBN-146]|uniref:GNAT family N-acetyltransferase n=1 Tax=Microbacterium sp. SLBN-146 TaxID=2768457 RepID=UPI001153954E|nr:GNAT family N-acetyltransferase [Microbacterium sp. SLBN-146]
MSDLRLEPPSPDLLDALVALPPRPSEPANVAPVVYSLAEAYVTPTAWPRAILDGENVVGFVMANFDAENEIAAFRAGVWRLNIDTAAQGRGVGRFAVMQVADEARRRGFDAITVLWEPGDDGPEKFYLTLGFVPTGEELFGERVGILRL